MKENLNFAADGATSKSHVKKFDDVNPFRKVSCKLQTLSESK
ncbi:hypothetical protein [Segatella maculosa]|nr:hypothetical protein [Segatella maculosa]